MELLIKTIFGSGRRPSDLALCITTLINANEEMNDIMKIIKFLEETGFLIKVISEIIIKKGDF